jgi:hypothetical protein
MCCMMFSEQCFMYRIVNAVAVLYSFCVSVLTCMCLCLFACCGGDGTRVIIFSHAHP